MENVGLPKLPTKIPPMNVSWEQLSQLPRHKRIGYALRNYVTSNSLGNAEVVRYLTDTALAVADATGNPTIHMYTRWTRSAFQLMELTKVVRSMVKIQAPDGDMPKRRVDNSLEAIVASTLVKYFEFKSVEHAKVNSEVLALDFVVQYCLDVTEAVLRKHKLKLVAFDRHETDTYGSSEILYVFEHLTPGYGRFALLFNVSSSMANAIGRRTCSIFHESRTNSTMRDEVIAAFMAACTEFFCSSFDTETNYISVQSNGDLMTVRKSDMSDIEVSTLDYQPVKAEIEYALSKHRKFATMWAGNPGLGKTVAVRKLMWDMPKTPFILLSPINNASLLEKQFQMLRNFQGCVVVLDDLEKFGVAVKSTETAKVLLSQVEGSSEGAAFKGVIISIVNNPAEVDEALKRPKRFGDRVILVDYPKSEPAMVAIRKQLTVNNIKPDSVPADAFRLFVDRMVEERFSFADIDSCTERFIMLVEIAQATSTDGVILYSELFGTAIDEMLRSREVAAMHVEDGVLVEAQKSVREKRESSKLSR